MPYECAEQPLSRSVLEDTGAPVLMEIMMVGSPEDICLLTGSLQSPGIRGGPGAAPSRGDTWRPQSFPEPGAGAQAAGTRGGPGAASSRKREPEPWGHVVAPSQERELEPRGHVTAPELPSVGRREPLS
jgi:hypothetical protein